jgi:hypothetical protein
METVGISPGLLIQRRLGRVQICMFYGIAATFSSHQAGYSAYHPISQKAKGMVNFSFQTPTIHKYRGMPV